MDATGVTGLPLCAGCSAQVRCFRVAAEFHRGHKARVVCGECAGLLDSLFGLLNDMSAALRGGVPFIVSIKTEAS
jgi:hypothetical protein